MKPQRSPEFSTFHSRKIVMPDQINPNGTLFGGVLMSWIDMLAYMTAQRHSENNNVVTVNVDQLSFKKPIRIGDHVLLSSALMRTGTSSMDILVQAEREDGRHGNRELATRAVLTFVSLDSAGKPLRVPRLLLKRKHLPLESEALLRMKIQSRFDRYLARIDLKQEKNINRIQRLQITIPATSPK